MHIGHIFTRIALITEIKIEEMMIASTITFLNMFVILIMLCTVIKNKNYTMLKITRQRIKKCIIKVFLSTTEHINPAEASIFLTLNGTCT